MKVLIADDHALFRDGLSLNLERIDPQAVVFQAGSFSQALKILDDEKKLDLIIIDLDMPDMQWEEGLAELRKKSNGARYVVISATAFAKVWSRGSAAIFPNVRIPKF